MQGRWLLVVLSVALTAGCLGLADQDVEAQEDEADAEGAVGGSAEPQAGEETHDESLHEATLDAPPTWEVGDWWTVEISSPLVGESFTVTRVVTGTEAGDYLVGMPKDAWDERALIVHTPGFGGVGQEDLGFEVHDVRFQPVHFPLTDDTTWETQYEGDPVEANVTVNADGTATIEYCCEREIQATYDPSIGALSTFSLDGGFIAYDVIDHGADYEGVVTVPHGHDLVLFHGRALGLLDIQNLEPAPPMEEVTLREGYYDRVSFMQMVGPLGMVEQPASSHYIERATAPDGTVFETSNPPTSTELTLTFHEHETVGGTWAFEHIAPGPGAAFTEGIAYHVFDVDMPTGTLLTGHEHHDEET